MDLSPEKTAAIQANARKAALAFLTHRIPHPVGSPERALFEQAFAGQVQHVVGLPGGEFITGTLEEAGHGFEPGAHLRVGEDGALERVGSGLDDNSQLARYVVRTEPEVGDEFVVRVLGVEGDSAVHVYIRPADRDGETVDFRLEDGGVKMLFNEGELLTVNEEGDIVRVETAEPAPEQSDGEAAG